MFNKQLQEIDFPEDYNCFSFFLDYMKRKLRGKLVPYSQITDFKLVAKNVCFMLNFLSISVSDIWDIYDCIKVLFRDVGSFL